MRFICLTRENNLPVWVNVAHVASVAPSTRGSHVRIVGTDYRLGEWVLESPSAVVALLVGEPARSWGDPRFERRVEAV